MIHVTNQRLQKAIAKHFENIAKLCSVWPQMKGNEARIDALINLKASPLHPSGTYRPLVLRLSEALGMLPEQLFPLELYEGVLPVWVKPTAIVPEFFDDGIPEEQGDDPVVEQAQYNSLKERIRRVLRSLPYREREIIKLRLGLDDGYQYTLVEVGHIFKVSPRRVRQLELSGWRRLAQTDRSQELVEFL